LGSPFAIDGEGHAGAQTRAISSSMPLVAPVMGGKTGKIHSGSGVLQ